MRPLARLLAAELVGTFALVFAGCGAIMVDAKTGALGHVGVAAIGGTVGLDAMFGGPISGASMNPARSIGPAFVSGDLHALWLYIVAPFAGAALGALVYQFIRDEPAHPADLADAPDAQRDGAARYDNDLPFMPRERRRRPEAS